MSPFETVLVLVLMWIAFVPACVARIAQVITTERITDYLRAVVEHHWPGTLLDYLVHCPRCMSHWVSAAIVLLSWAIALLWLKGQMGLELWAWGPATAPVAFVVWGGTTEIAIKLWLRSEDAHAS